jgi:hypothetical protein
MWFGHIYEAATGVDQKGGPIGQGLVATSFSSWFDGTASHSGNAASASDYPLVPINSAASATLAAIRRASSLVSNLAAERRPGSSSI